MDPQQPSETITYTSLKEKFSNYQKYLSQVKTDRKNLLGKKFTNITWKETKLSTGTSSDPDMYNISEDVIQNNMPEQNAESKECYAFFATENVYKLINFIKYCKFRIDTYIETVGSRQTICWVFYYSENNSIKYEIHKVHQRDPVKEQFEPTFEAYDENYDKVVFQLNDGAVLSEDEKTLLTTVLSKDDFTTNKKENRVVSAAKNVMSKLFNPSQYGGKSRRIRRTKRSRAKSTRTKRRYRK